MANRHKIASMEVVGNTTDIGREASQRIASYARYRYSARVIYTSEDGRDFDSVVRGMTKPKLAERIATNQRHVANAAMSYEQSTYDDTWFQIVSLSIGVA